MDVANNRSPRDFDEHVAIYNNIREAGRAAGKDVAVLVDLQGPKIRCGWIEKDAEGEDKVQLAGGQEFVITTDDITGNKDRVSTYFQRPSADCNPGDPILIDDGKVRLEVTGRRHDVHTKVIVAGPCPRTRGSTLPALRFLSRRLQKRRREDLLGVSGPVRTLSLCHL